MKRKWTAIATILVYALILSPTTKSLATEKNTLPKHTPVETVKQKPREYPRNLLGGWLGMRSFLEDRGVRVSLYYKHYWGNKVRGGRQSGNDQRHSGSGDLFVLANLEKMGLAPGGEIFLQAKNNFGKNINTKVARLSDPFDDADFNEPFYIDQLWYQQSLFDQKINRQLVNTGKPAFTRDPQPRTT